jgi:hypothetical protein
LAVFLLTKLLSPTERLTGVPASNLMTFVSVSQQVSSLLSLPVFEQSHRFAPLLSASFRSSCWQQPTVNEYDRPYSTFFFSHSVLWLMVHFRLPPVRGSWIGDASCFCCVKLSCRRTVGPKALHGLW